MGCNGSERSVGQLAGECITSVNLHLQIALCQCLEETPRLRSPASCHACALRSLIPHPLSAPCQYARYV